MAPMTWVESVLALPLAITLPSLENVLAFERVIDFHVPQQLTDFSTHLKLNNQNH
jgi:hypothetical protein